MDIYASNEIAYDTAVSNRDCSSRELPCICTKRMWRCEDFLKLTAQFEKAVINSISNPDEELQRELTIELIAEVIIKVRNDRLSQRVERERRKIPSIL